MIHRRKKAFFHLDPLFCLSPSIEEKISKRNAKILVATTWLYALLWAIFPLIGWGKYGPESFGLSCTLAWRDMKEHSQSFVITIFLMNLIFPAIIIMSCYSGIALKLYVTYKSMDDSNHIPNMIKMQRRLMVVSVFDLQHVPATLLL